MPRDGAERMRADFEEAEEFGWAEPDMAVLRLHRRPPPVLPLDVFGADWGHWISDAAAAAACPPDYVASPLLASASTLIGNARWAQATPGWSEPPHLWTADVGDSGNGKSPGADCLLRDVLPEIERRMLADFPDRLKAWRVERRAGEGRQGGMAGRGPHCAKTGKGAALPAARAWAGTAGAAPPAERRDD